ncbi:MAG: hypothetical protein H8E34_00050 [Bacteroidetes bacterium]|nr:hypothetical protein [Bacteroidota bacterium]
MGAIISGDIEIIKRIHDERIQSLTDVIIFARCNCDGTWKVLAGCLGWVQQNAKTLDNRQFAELIAKYNFQVLEITHKIFINGIVPNTERMGAGLEGEAKIEYFTNELERICKEASVTDLREWLK